MYKFLCFFLVSLTLCQGCQKKEDPHASFREIDRIGKKLASSYHMKYLLAGLGSIVHSDSCVYAISLSSNEKMHLEEGDAFVSAFLKDYFAHIDASYKILNDEALKKACTKNFKPEIFGARIAFWDENVNRPLYPYLAQIRIADGKVFFYYANPQTQKLEKPVVKSLEDYLNIGAIACFAESISY